MKKTGSILLAALLLMGVLWGCGSESEVTGDMLMLAWKHVASRLWRATRTRNAKRFESAYGSGRASLPHRL